MSYPREYEEALYEARMEEQIKRKEFSRQELAKDYRKDEEDESPSKDS